MSVPLATATGARRRAVTATRARAWLALLALVSCTRATGTQASDTGAVMASEGVSIRRLGDVSPHMTYVGTSGRDYVDPSPIVMWGGARPAAALFLEIASRERKAVQKIAPLEKGVRLPGFPITYTVHVPEGTPEHEVEALDTNAIVSADVDGDGVQELVVAHRHGGVEVHSVRGPVASYPSPGGGYRRYLAEVTALGGRDVVFVLSRSEDPATSDRNLLLRVDGRGVVRVALKGLEKAKVLALGAVQRPGSQELDELLVLVADGDRDAALARFRPDGTPIAPPRRMYVRPPPGSAFQFVPRSARAVLLGETGAFVLAPEQPVNWIRTLDAVGQPNPRTMSLLEVVDPGTDPKLVYEDRGALWAVDHDGTCFAPDGGGRWKALAKPGPYLRLPVGPGGRLQIVWRGEGGRIFAVDTREQGTRQLSHDEWRRAGDRYLPAAEAEALRMRLEPSLDRPHTYRDMCMEDERKERKVVGEVRSVDDWKRLLPRSYAEVLAYDAKGYDVDVASRLEELGGDPKAAQGTPDPAGLRAFLKDLDAPARTAFLVVEGTQVSSVEVPGALPRLLETQVGGPVEYRIHDGRLTAIATLEVADPAGKAKPAFYLVEGPLAARR